MNKKLNFNFVKKMTALFKNAESLAWYDWLIFAILAIICFFFTQHRDLAETISHSYGFLHGHITDFYTYNHNGWGFLGVEGCNYLPSTYIIFAIWCLPLKLMGLVQEFPMPFVSDGIGLYCKILTTAAYLASGYMMYKICLTIGFDEKKSKLGMYLFLTSPLGFFSQFIFAQYDIFTVLFILIGVYFYFKNDFFKFAIFMGFACTFKYFTLLFFIPLLLLKEKNVWKIIRSCLIFFIPIAVEVLLFIHDKWFVIDVLKYTVANHITNAQINLGLITISLIPVLFVILCAFCYLYKPDETEQTSLAKNAAFFCNIISFFCFGLCYWHPQWLLLAVPFWTLSILMSKHFDIWMLLDFILMAVFCIYVVNLFPANVDQNLLRRGILDIGTEIKTSLSMRELYVYDDIPMLFSIFSGILAAFIIFSHPKYLLRNFNDNTKRSGGFIRFRFVAGILFFLIPLFVCAVYYFKYVA